MAWDIMPANGSYGVFRIRSSGHKQKQPLTAGGGMSIFWTRFLITGIAVPVNLIAGTSDFRFRRFFLYDLLGESIWIFGYGSLGYLFGTQWEVVSDFLSNMSGLMLGLVILAVGIWLGIRQLKKNGATANSA